MDDEPWPMRYIRIFGIVQTAICLVVQLKPRRSTIDEKIFTQITMAILLDTIAEFVLAYNILNLSESIFLRAVLWQSRAVTLCWIYLVMVLCFDKDLSALKFGQWHFIVMCCVVWVLIIPVGVIETGETAHIGADGDFNFNDLHTTWFTWLKLFALPPNVMSHYKIYGIVVKDNSNNVNVLVSIAIGFVVYFFTVCFAFLHILVVPDNVANEGLWRLYDHIRIICNSSRWMLIASYLIGPKIDATLFNHYFSKVLTSIRRMSILQF